MKIKRILHASDFSRASHPAFGLARELAATLRAELILCHAYQAVTPLDVGEGYVSAGVIKELWSSARASARRRLDRLAASAKRGRLRVSTVLVEGPPAASIVRAAKRKRANLLVLGTRGRTGVRRLVLGSVAERVVRTAPCPVVTVAGKG
jgi:nucleotide-binding universal stress UspA family protein